MEIETEIEIEIDRDGKRTRGTVREIKIDRWSLEERV